MSISSQDPNVPASEIEISTLQQAPLVVGIGASAGGLEAFIAFFAHMPADNDVAFVLVQHLAPEHASLLSEILSRSTTMPVSEASDQELIQGGHVYVIPPDATLTMREGRLEITEPAPPRAQRWPINTFFSSLAEECGDRAVSIVLSGTGTDGAIGLRRIKEYGGLTLAQAGFDHVALTGMPASAASTGMVDDVLPVEAMPERLLRYRKQMLASKKKEVLGKDNGSEVKTLFRLLKSDIGHDFSQYKRSTLHRRIQRRMLVRQTETISGYIAYVKHHPEEYRELFREMLISVTEFFRDPGTFSALQEHAIPAMLSGKGAADILRVWVPGCATGEEAYSIAILIRESIGLQNGPRVQIFATDIDDKAIEAARAGRFKGPLEGVTNERVDRWFIRDGEDFCVVKEVREMCVFSPHSVIKDPPFSRLDLISCRNLLIYLNAELQDRLFQTFHYALRPGGFLLLGPSEGLGRNSSLFSVLDKKHRLYSRRESAHSESKTFPLPGLGTAMPSLPSPSIKRSADESIDRHARKLLEKYSPAYVVINAKFDIERFAGDTGRYLSPSTGTASLNIFGLLQKRLREPARALVQKAFASAKAVVHEGISIDNGTHAQSLRLIAEPLSGEDGIVQWCVLAFDEKGTTTFTGNHKANEGSPEEISRIQTLQGELESVYTQLHTAIEMHESAIEELKSTNEEYQSVNEELQSSNEELETSKEEMQSINEELQIINAEVHSKNETLTRLNSDLRNLMDSTLIATLFLDRDMRIGSYTPAVTELFHLRESDRGRPITDISARINYPELKQDVAEVLRYLRVVERILQGTDTEPVFLLRIRPYRTVGNVIDGTVLTFVDITETVHQDVERAHLAAIVDSSRDAVIGYTVNDKISSWNSSAERIFGYTKEQAIGLPLGMLLPSDATDEAKAILALKSKEDRPEEFETSWKKQSGEIVPLTVSNSPVRNAQGERVAGSFIARDISDRRRNEKHARMMLGELNHRVKNTLASIQAVALQSLAGASGLEAFRVSFLARLKSLSETHNLLAEDAWHGINLLALIRSELAPYQAGHGAIRVYTQGNDVVLSPKIALALSMALHELSTNAMKYGALSVSEGRIEVTWETREVACQPWLHVQWLELGGPKVTVPSTRGFGTRLITQGLAFELDGEVALDFLESGVRCSIDLPLSEATASS